MSQYFPDFARDREKLIHNLEEYINVFSGKKPMILIESNVSEYTISDISPEKKRELLFLLYCQASVNFRNLKLIYEGDTKDYYTGQQICSLCEMPTDLACSSCQNVFYCSKECQVKDWNENISRPFGAWKTGDPRLYPVGHFVFAHFQRSKQHIISGE